MAHADAPMMQRVRNALNWWETIETGPTSSITGRGALAYLETSFGNLVNDRLCIALSSGTNALQVALASVGVGRDDEVICPAYDWPAAAAVVRSLAARPVFAQVDPETLTIDPVDARRRVTPKTKAIVATHLFGIPADVPAIRRYADHLGLPVVEDAAQALGAKLDGAPVGSLGAAAAFSLGPGKLVDCGEGGVATFQHRELYEHAMAFSQHPVRQLLVGLTPQTEGFSARMPSISAILAAYALGDITRELGRRLDQFHAVERAAESSGYQLIGIDERRRPNWYRIPVRIRNLRTDLTAPTASITLARPGISWLGDIANRGRAGQVRTAHPRLCGGTS